MQSFEVIFITSEERREQRYKRRVAERLKRKIEQCASCDDFDRVFTYENLYKSYKKCIRNVAWKASVQKYISNAPTNIYKTYNELKVGRYRSPGFHQFEVNDRGKSRIIKSTVISERVVQRCLCDYSLVPMLTRSFIYDNGASLPNKGLSFAEDRLKKHITQHIRKHGNNGYILLFDFSKFFDNVSHENIRNILNSVYSDARILSLLNHFIDMFGDKGLGIGSQISQVLSLASANRLDHYIKEVLRIKGYGRYMDDGYLIHNDKNYLKYCLEQIKKVCLELGIKLNLKKTQIVKLSHGFTWCKTRYLITNKGKIIRKISKGGIAKVRRKLKKLSKLLENKEITCKDAYAALQGWRGYAANYNSYHTVKSVERLYNKLFLGGNPNEMY